MDGPRNLSEPEKHVLSGFPDAALRFFRVLEQNRRRVAFEHGLSEIELRAFFRVAAAGTITPKDLAFELSLTKGAITGVSTRLVAAGVLRRVEHPVDRRSLHLELTPAGHDEMRVMHEDFRAMLSSAGTQLTESDLSRASEVLEELSRTMAERPDGGQDRLLG
ncbi:DNA-binding MarR family transcriptional regulator [Glaciihabitans tibetensis]|uniref:DNA-binding MarR family transcriptional regulator n=1 Tax=Glaciihabitans tibetensis TaxID=1266600 RepID=A0A2T0V9Y0_9MICO|nr:MarR family winged helix-turn-helix transcriptional regulator [Glaciihabitans tibetensis]PRY66954.1 DNA-binding MarR family transcriptional regulator [Glaciihabitans tibetensis]